MNCSFQNCLRSLKLSVLFALAASTGVSAQVQDSVQNSLEPLPSAVIVAQRPAVARQSVGHTFDIITREELMQLPVSSVAEALAFVGGLDLRQRGPRGVQADLSIRGGTFDQVLVLVNGIKLYDPQTGHHVLNIPVPMENVERIEILKGPGARLYGQNAFAGAINIVTRSPTENGGQLRASVGENGLAGFGASLDVKDNQFSHMLSYQRDLSQGYRYNTDFDIQNFLYQGEMLGPFGKLSLLAAMSDRAFGANGFYASARATEQFEDIQTSVLGINHRFQYRGLLISQRVSWRRNQDEYVFVRSNPSIYRNMHISHTYGYDGYVSKENKLGRLGVGLEIQGQQLSSNLLGQHNRTLVNALVEHAFEWLDGDLEVTPGVTFNYLSDAGERFLPGLDLNYQMLSWLNLYGNAGMTFRVPTYTDLYYRDPYNEGNPDLQAERAYAFELGALAEVGRFQVRSAVWWRRGIDLIDFVRDSEQDTVWQPRNLQDIDFRGLELHSEWRRPLPWIDLIQINYNFIDADPFENDQVQVSRYALENLRHQVNARATFRVAKALFISPAFRYADRVSEPAPGVLPLDYALLDLRLDYRRSKWSVFAEATNLTDEPFSQTNGVPMPGRWMRTGLEIKL